MHSLGTLVAGEYPGLIGPGAGGKTASDAFAGEPRKAAASNIIGDLT